jgi:RNA polymerase sigma-70 factor (ECF subfamily)
MNKPQVEPSEPQVTTQALSPVFFATATAAQAERRDELSRLCDRAQAGDKGAFEDLIRATYDRAYTVACHMLRSRDDAKDVVQEAYIRVQRHLPDFQRDAAFSTWLYRVVVNLCLDWHRKRKYIDPKVETNDRVVASPDRSPEASSQDQELARLLEAGMATLSEQHRAVLVLFEIEGLSYDEIAEVTRSRVGPVMSRLFYAQQFLIAHGVQPEEGATS